MISQDKADECCRRLKLLRFMPSEAEAIADLIGILCSTCETDVHADWLVHELQTKFPEWPGSAKVVDVYNSHFATAETSSLKKWNPEYNPGERFVPTCETCADVGFYRNRHGVYVRCTCDAASGIPAEKIALFNDRIKRNPGAKMLRAGEFADVLKRVQEQGE